MNDVYGLAKRHFLFVGVGSLGSVMAEMAVRSGATMFTLVDPAKVEEHHLERHIALERDVGKQKACAVLERLYLTAECDVIQNYNEFRPELVSAETGPLAMHGGRDLTETTIVNVRRNDALICSTRDERCRKVVNAAAMDTKVPALFVRYWPNSKGGLCQEGAKASCCTKDEGRSFGAALWEEASNCRKLLRSKAAVVNVPVKRRGYDHVMHG